MAGANIGVRIVAAHLQILKRNIQTKQSTELLSFSTKHENIHTPTPSHFM